MAKDKKKEEEPAKKLSKLAQKIVDIDVWLLENKKYYNSGGSSVRIEFDGKREFRDFLKSL